MEGFLSGISCRVGAFIIWGVYPKLRFLWLVIPVLLAWGFFQKKMSAPLGYSVGMSVSFLLVVAYFAGIPMIEDYSSRRAFDSTLWKSKSDMKEGVRIHMIDDLMKRHKLIGMTKESIEKLLGEPPESEYFRGTCDWLYWLGPERGFMSIDSEWLCIKYTGDMASEAKIVRD